MLKLAGTALPDRAVLLTFDDGTADALELLHPLLGEMGVRGALFAIPGWAGSVRDDGRGRRDHASLARWGSAALHAYADELLDL
jgi:peptidoglycan/xylan/chitin deacetylase (PgdA/CDA1 family)